MKGAANKSKLILVGYRATGKSTLGRLLAGRWGFGFVDTDVAIEKRAERSIAQIFKRDGERRFRDLEERVVADALNAPEPLVVATGGGAPLRESTRRLMKERGVIVRLVASVETIAKRMRGDQTTSTRRPSLTGDASPVAEIERVLTEREPIYRDVATFEIDTDGKTIDELVVEIADRAPEFFI